MILIIAIIQFISMWVEMSKFGKLTTTNMPGATQNDIDQMRKKSTLAFWTMLAFIILGFIPNAFVPSRPDYFSDAGKIDAYNSAISTVGDFSAAILFVGLLLSGFFYSKAVLLKRRCQTQAVVNKPASSTMRPKFIGKRILGGIAVIIGAILSTSTTLREESGNIWTILGLFLIIGGIIMAIRPNVLK